LFREVIITLDDRIPHFSLTKVIRDIAQPYVEAGEVVIPVLHCYGTPVRANSGAGQRLYTEIGRRGLRIVYRTRSPDFPHVRRWTDRIGYVWLQRYTPHVHLLRTTRYLLPEGFGHEDRNRNHTSVVTTARRHACTVLNQALIAAGHPGDLDHRAKRAEVREFPAAPTCRATCIGYSRPDCLRTHGTMVGRIASPPAPPHQCASQDYTATARVPAAPITDRAADGARHAEGDRSP
jgi:hypothetical protein